MKKDTPKLSKVIEIDEARIKDHLGELVRGSVEDTLNALLAFYDFPTAHWQHIRTTNPIESTFATVQLRTPPVYHVSITGSDISWIYPLYVLSDSI